MASSVMPWRTIFIILLVQFSEAMMFYVLVPIVPFLVEHLGYDHSASSPSLSFHAGHFNSYFYIGAIVATPAWGLLSDKVGRRPVILCGLLLPQICLAMIATVPSLQLALLLRILQGLLGANLSLVKNVMAEVCDQDTVARGMSLLLLPFSVAQVVGPTIGGFFAKPAVRDYLQMDLFNRFPFLPSLSVPLLLSLCIFPFAAWLLPESHPRLQHPQNSPQHEQQPLVSAQLQKGGAKAIWVALQSDGAALSVLLYGMVAGSFYALLTVVPLWLKLGVAHGGYQLDSWNTGLIMASSGPLLFITQPFLSPLLIHTFGLRRAWGMECAIFGFLVLLMPFCSETSLGAPLLCGMWISQNVVYQMVLSGTFVMQNNTVPPEVRGMFVGMATAVAGLARLLLPSISASLFAWAVGQGSSWPINHHLTFDVLGCIVLLASMFSLYLPCTVDCPSKTPQSAPSSNVSYEQKYSVSVEVK